MPLAATWAAMSLPGLFVAALLVAVAADGTVEPASVTFIYQAPVSIQVPVVYQDEQGTELAADSLIQNATEVAEEYVPSYFIEGIRFSVISEPAVKESGE